MSEDCQKCGTAMWDLDEDRHCPGCSDYDSEDMPIIEIDMSGCKEYKREDYIDILTTCGTFDTKDCISVEDLTKQLKDEEKQND